MGWGDPMHYSPRFPQMVTIYIRWCNIETRKMCNAIFWLFVPPSCCFSLRNEDKLGLWCQNLIVIYQNYLRESTLMVLFLPSDFILTWPIWHRMTWDSARLCMFGGQLAVETSNLPISKPWIHFGIFRALFALNPILTNYPPWLGWDNLSVLQIPHNISISLRIFVKYRWDKLRKVPLKSIQALCVC